MYQQKVYLNRILRMSWSASLILVLYLSCIAIVAPVHPSGRFLILWIFCYVISHVYELCITDTGQPRTLLLT